MRNDLSKDAKKSLDELFDKWRFGNRPHEDLKPMEGKLTYLTLHNNLIAMFYRHDGLIHIYSKELDDNFKVGQYSHKYARSLFKRNVMRGMKGYEYLSQEIQAMPMALYCNTTWRSSYGRNVTCIPPSRTIVGTCLNLINDALYHPMYFMRQPNNNKMYFMRFRDDKPVQAHAIQSGNGQIHKLKLEKVIDIKQFINIAFKYDARDYTMSCVLGNGD